MIDMTKVGQLLVTPINTCCVMEALLQNELASSRVVSLGRGGGGCISDGQSYETDSGRVFVRRNSDQKATILTLIQCCSCRNPIRAKIMFDGEYIGLKKILETGIVTVPKPMKVSDSYCTIHGTFKAVSGVTRTQWRGVGVHYGAF